MLLPDRNNQRAVATAMNATINTTASTLMPCDTNAVHSRMPPIVRVPDVDSGLQAGNLRTLQADARHQTLLAEDECVDVGLGGQRVDVLGRPGIDDHDRRTDPDLESLALLERTHRSVAHEEDRKAERLGAGLQSDRNGGRVVIADLPAFLDQRAVAA